MPSTTLSRQPEYPVHSLFLQRWSPRSYTGEAIPEATLFAAFEAARWAPSSINFQPWRFLYSTRGSASWDRFIDLINPNNRVWAEKASALIVVVSSKNAVTRDGEIRPSKTHSFDTGAAWQSFALQITESGWHAHAIGGFDRDKARAALRVPDDFAVEIAIAVGRQGEKSALPADLQEREVPTPRRPLRELIFEGGFQPA